MLNKYYIGPILSDMSSCGIYLSYNPYCRNRQYSYVYVCIGYIYLTKYDLMLYHPSALYLTPPWGVSTNQGKDIRAYVNGVRAWFLSLNPGSCSGCFDFSKFPTETQGKYENASAPL